MGVLTLSDHGSVEYLYGIGDGVGGLFAGGLFAGGLFASGIVWSPNAGGYSDAYSNADTHSDTYQNKNA